ncbi:MAG: MFS transporter [Pseudomonadota bacterium]
MAASAIKTAPISWANRMINALKNKQFQLYFFGAFFAVQAIWIQRVTLAWLAWERSGSAGFVGVVAGLSLAPALIAGPVFGVIADRVDIRRAAQASTGAMMATLFCLAATAPMIGPIGIAVAATVIGCVSSAHHPVRMSLGPRLVPQPLVPYVVAAQALNFNIARLVAPALTGLSIAVLGAGTTLWVAVVALVPMQTVLLRLKPRALPPRPKRSISTDMAEAFAHIRDTPGIRLAFLLTIIFGTVTRGALELLPVLADGVFERGATGLGVLTGVVGAGAVVTAALRAIAAGEISADVPNSVKVAGAGALLALIAMGLAPSWGSLLVFTAIAGAMATWCGVSLQAVIQSGLADEMRGRVMSFWVVVGFGMVAVGAFAIGGLAEVVGIGPALVLAGFCGLLAQLWVLFGGAVRRVTP